jgi:hypothetical protein
VLLDKFRRFLLRFKNQFFFFLVAVLVALGAYIGFITVDRYKMVVDATLGITVLYLLYEKFLSPQRNSDESTGIQVKLPQDLKYLIYACTFTIIGFWAGVQVIHLIRYLVNSLIR